MSDQPPPPTAGSNFCAECGAAMPVDARFCGSCGAAPSGAASDPTEAMPAAGPAGASTWQGVQPVVARTPEVPPAAPGAAAGAAAGGPPPSVAGGPPAGPPAGGPPAGGPPAGGPPPADAKPKGKSKGPLILVVVLVLAALIGGAAVLLGGGSDDDDDGGDFSRDEAAEEADDEDEETTTTEADEETTTTVVDGETTLPADDGAEDLNFVTVQDDTGTLLVQVPDFWVVDGTTAADGSPTLQAAPDLESFRALVSSGLNYTRFAATRDADEVLEEVNQAFSLDEVCAVVNDRQAYDDGVFVGRSQIYENCGVGDMTLFHIVGTRADGATVLVLVDLLPEEPIEIVEQIQRTFNLA